MQSVVNWLSLIVNVINRTAMAANVINRTAMAANWEQRKVKSLSASIRPELWSAQHTCNNKNWWTGECICFTSVSFPSICVNTLRDRRRSQAPEAMHPSPISHWPATRALRSSAHPSIRRIEQWCFCDWWITWPLPLGRVLVCVCRCVWVCVCVCVCWRSFLRNFPLILIRPWCFHVRPFRILLQSLSIAKNISYTLQKISRPICVYVYVSLVSAHWLQRAYRFDRGCAINVTALCVLDLLLV